MKPLRSLRARPLGTRTRGVLRALTLLIALLCAGVASLEAPSPALGQAMNHTGSDRDGLPKIRNDTERKTFAGLACCCGGCPHEALSTCPCGYADGYRDEIRAMIAGGMTLEQINAEWVKRYGSDALTVPPNTGANRFLYMTPLFLIVAAAGFVIVSLRRFRRRSDEAGRVAAATAGGAPLPGGAHDEYDDKLDDELKQLDQDE